MRSTPSGETAYQVLSLYQVDVVFGPNHTHGNLLFEPANNRIVVYGKFHLDPPEVLAAFIASGAALVKWFHEHGEPTTLEQCIQREFLATSALDTWNLEKFGSRGKYSSTANTAAERYEREQRGVTYRLSQPLDSQFNNPILCPAVPRIQPVPATAPTPAPAVEYFTWPWTIVDEFGPEARLDHHLKNRGMRVGSSTYRFLARALRVYAYSAYPVYLVLLDSIGVPVKDVGDTEEWEDFVLCVPLKCRHPT